MFHYLKRIILCCHPPSLQRSTVCLATAIRQRNPLAAYEPLPHMAHRYERVVGTLHLRLDPTCSSRPLL